MTKMKRFDNQTDDVPMREVAAVKNTDTIRDIERYFVKHHSQREADIWRAGINMALRISDLLGIKFEDIKGDDLTLVESKTGKTRVIHLNKGALKIIERRRKDNPDDTYLFQSVGRNVSSPKPVSRQVVAKAFQEVGELVGVHLGTHSMRKTRGYHLYKNGVSLATICKLLNHSSVATTLKYIGIDADDIKKTYTDLVL